jgi:hypothetical protein
MSELELGIPEGIVNSLPEDGDGARQDMLEAVAGWESRLNAALDDEGVEAVVDVVERFEDRWERYDEYVVELRAWGQSPIYAMAWRDLHAAVIRQLYDHEDLEERIDRERNARIVQDGIRPGQG